MNSTKLFEKVNPSHPDKVADRIAGAIVDFTYSHCPNPKIAVEVLIGHGTCTVISETSYSLNEEIIDGIVHRIVPNTEINTRYIEVPQDSHLARNQSYGLKCGDNGIFKGVPTSDTEKSLTTLMQSFYAETQSDGKAITTPDGKTLCLSNVDKIGKDGDRLFNPLGLWTGGINVDCGATNRKLGSDMGRAVTGGGLHGKDFSKADVSVNIWCHVMAQQSKEEINAWCSIGDTEVHYLIGDNPNPLTVGFEECVRVTAMYIGEIGGFEKLAEWGLIR